MGHREIQIDTYTPEEHKEGNGIANEGAAVVCTINTEIGTLLAAMRRNVRWGGRFVLGDKQLEDPIVHSLKALRKQIINLENEWINFNPVTYLQPFLDVIQSDETGAPITGIALSSIYKILTLDVFDLDTENIADTMHLIVDTVTSCHFEVTDPASEEQVLMKILQVLLACMKSKASGVLSNRHVCMIVNTCFRVIHRAGTKRELLRQIARDTMHELIRCIFSRLPEIDSVTLETTDENGLIQPEYGGLSIPHNYMNRAIADNDSSPRSSLVADAGDHHSDGAILDKEAYSYDLRLMKQPYGLPCMVEVFQFLCSLLDIAEREGIYLKSNTLAFDEDVPLLAHGLINSAIKFGGPSFRKHPRLLILIQDDLFFNLIQCGSSTSPLILAMVCSIVRNLFNYMRAEIKLQLEVFFSYVILRLAQSRYGASYQQQEIAMEALVDFCRQKTFLVEMYANFDSEITSSNVFEDLVNLLSKSAFPVNSPLSALNTVALDGLIAVIQAMAERTGDAPLSFESPPAHLEEYTPFWMLKCEDYKNPSNWVPFIRHTKYIKRKLTIGADHFNKSPKRGFEYLQSLMLLPEELDPKSVACFFRYTAGLDKYLIGDFLGDRDEFCVEVLLEFARTFDFHEMSLDTALRIFLESFRLPGEAEKINRVLEAFAESYYERSHHQLFFSKDAILLLSLSVILLNTDLRNAQIKKKMSEEEFIRMNNHVNGGNNIPRDYLSELYHSIRKNEIITTPELRTGFPDISPSLWIDLMLRSGKALPYILTDNRPYFDYDMFAKMAGPTIAAISVIYDHAEEEDVCRTCIDGFTAVAKVSATYHLADPLDDLVISLCKFTGLLNPLRMEEFLGLFSERRKVRMAITTLFTLTNSYGDYIRKGWRNILDCVLRLHEFGLLPAQVTVDSVDGLALSSYTVDEKTSTRTSSSTHFPSTALPRRPSGLIELVSQLLSLDKETRSGPPEEVRAHQRTMETIKHCHVINIFSESKFLQADSLVQLAGAIIAAGRSRETLSAEGNSSAVFCLELLITVTLNNRDRISLLWSSVYEHICHIVQMTAIPCALVEKAVFGLLNITQRLMPYKEDLVDELLRSLQLVLKLDARVVDAYCEQVTHEVGRLVKANAGVIQSQMGWRTVLSLLAITARHPEASGTGFDALSFIMNDGAYLSPSNFVLCVDAAKQFAESRVCPAEVSIYALDLMADSVDSLVRWANETKEALMVEDAVKLSQDIGEMWLKLVQGFRKTCLDSREEVRNQSLLSLQKCLVVAHDACIPHEVWVQCFDLVIFSMLDELFGIAQGYSQKTHHGIEGTLVIAIKLLYKVFMLSLDEPKQPTSFSKLWLGVLDQTEKYMKIKIRGKRSEKLQELLPELLKNTLLVMKMGGVLEPATPAGGELMWDLTWSHVNNIAPSLLGQIFSDSGSESLEHHHAKSEPAQVASNLPIEV